MQNIDVIVIGGGTSGCAAATLLARNRRKTMVIDSAPQEGFLGSLGNVSYFPGVTDSTSGEELVERFRKQGEQTGVQFRQGRVEKIAEGEQPQVSVYGGEKINARALLVASGAALRSNYLDGEKEFHGRGVSHDAALDGPIFAHRTVAVVGKNNKAAMEALALSRYANRIVFVIPSSKLDADEAIIREVKKQNRIELFFSTSLKKINGGDSVSSVTVFTGGKEKELEVNGVFTYVHDYQPAIDYLKGVVECSKEGAVKIDADFKTSAKGIFACGDVLCAKPQIPAIACAQGILAGLSIDRYLEQH
jgi:thioredoxin reductase (NADPH)